jgi:hypothetical protein
MTVRAGLVGGGWSMPGPGSLTPEKETRYLHYRRKTGPRGRSRRARNISTPLVFEPRTVHPVENRYNYHTIPTVTLINSHQNFGKKPTYQTIRRHIPEDSDINHKTIHKYFNLLHMK